MLIMIEHYTGPERRSRPPIYVPEDLEGMRRYLMDHLGHEADIRSHFDAQLAEIRDLLHTQVSASSQMAPAVEELTTILSGFKFLKRTAVVLAGIVGSLYAVWQAVKDHVRF